MDEEQREGASEQREPEQEALAAKQETAQAGVIARGPEVRDVVYERLPDGRQGQAKHSHESQSAIDEPILVERQLAADDPLECVVDEPREKTRRRQDHSALPKLRHRGSVGVRGTSCKPRGGVIAWGGGAD